MKYRMNIEKAVLYTTVKLNLWAMTKNKSYLLKFNSIKMILQLTLKVHMRNIQPY